MRFFGRQRRSRPSRFGNRLVLHWLLRDCGHLEVPVVVNRFVHALPGSESSRLGSPDRCTGRSFKRRTRCPASRRSTSSIICGQQPNARDPCALRTGRRSRSPNHRSLRRDELERRSARSVNKCRNDTGPAQAARLRLNDRTRSQPILSAELTGGRPGCRSGA
jgi:hypothetical protein